MNLGFLSDVGRSGGVGQLGQSLLGNVMQYGQYMQQAQTNQLQQQLVQSKIAEQERMNRPKLLSELLSQGTEKGKPNSTKIFIEAAKMAGAKKIVLPDGTEDYTITQNDIPNIQEFIKLQKDLHPQLMWAQYLDNQQIVPELQKQLAKAKTPMEGQGIQEQIEKLKIENASILTEFGKGTNEAQDPLEKVVGPDGKPVLIPRSQAAGLTPYTTETKDNEIELIRKANAGDPEAIAILKNKRDFQLQVAKEGRQAFAYTRAVQVLDTKQGNMPVTMNLADMEAGNKSEPGRYISSTAGVQALNKTALVEDIKGTVKDVRTALDKMPDLNSAQTYQLALALKHRDPRSSFSQFMSSQWWGTMTEEQQAYAVSLLQLVENAMAMRSLLGAGQGSDELRAAIVATLPGVKGRGAAKMQIDAFERVLNRLQQGIPSVPLAAPRGPIQAEQGGGEITVERGPDGKLIIRR